MLFTRAEEHTELSKFQVLALQIDWKWTFFTCITFLHIFSSQKNYNKNNMLHIQYFTKTLNI